MALTTAQAEPTKSRAMYVIAGVAVLITWPLGALLGSVVGQIVADPAALGLDAAFPALLGAQRRQRTTAGWVQLSGIATREHGTGERVGR